jgi:hypothetical protein
VSVLLKAEALVRDGRLVAADPARWVAALKPHHKVRVVVTVERLQERRSSQANRRYWWRVVRGVRAHLNVDRVLPLNKDQVHYVLACSFLGQEETPLGPIPRETHTLTTHEFTDYMDRIEAHFSGIGVTFPEVDDEGGEYE